MGLFSWLFKNTSTEKIPYPDGFQQKSGIGSYSKVLLNFNGWTLWEISHQGLIGFVAIKPAINTKSYHLPTSPLFISGGAGFFMNHMCHTAFKNELYFGFYGEHMFRQSQIAELDGNIVHNITSIHLASLQHKSIDFEVRTCLDKNPNKRRTNIIENKGTVYFDDIQLIYNEMMACVNAVLSTRN